MQMIESFTAIIDQSKKYLDTKMEITRLKLVDKSAEVVSSIAASLFTIILAFLSITLFSIGLAIIIGKQLNGYEYGFLSLGGFYAILLLVFYFGREKWLKIPVANRLIEKMLK